MRQRTYVGYDYTVFQGEEAAQAQPDVHVRFTYAAEAWYWTTGDARRGEVQSDGFPTIDAAEEDAESWFRRLKSPGELLHEAARADSGEEATQGDSPGTAEDAAADTGVETQAAPGDAQGNTPVGEETTSQSVRRRSR